MRALVTGADGFVGQWLLRRLLRDSAQITGMIRAPKPALVTLDGTLAQRIGWRTCDIADASGLRSLVRSSAPEVVFHLAAQSFVPASQDHPLSTIETNVLGTTFLLEAVRAEAPKATVLVVGSSDAYGAVTAEQLPLREDSPIAPRNPYAASKAAAEVIVLQYARAGWCRAIATRSFNHTGPGQSSAFAVAAFARQIAAIKAKRKEPVLEVGDLTPRRDFSDVRDVVDAYVLLVQAGETGGVYNVCSGKDRSMEEIVVELMRIACVKAEIRRKPELVRSIETPVLRGDPSCIERQVGWRAATPIERTLADMLEHFSHAAA